MLDIRKNVSSSRKLSTVFERKIATETLSNRGSDQFPLGATTRWDAAMTRIFLGSCVTYPEVHDPNDAELPVCNRTQRLRSVHSRRGVSYPTGLIRTLLHNSDRGMDWEFQGCCRSVLTSRASSFSNHMAKKEKIDRIFRALGIFWFVSANIFISGGVVEFAADYSTSTLGGRCSIQWLFHYVKYNVENRLENRNSQST